MSLSEASRHLPHVTSFRLSSSGLQVSLRYSTRLLSASNSSIRPSPRAIGKRLLTTASRETPKSQVSYTPFPYGDSPKSSSVAKDASAKPDPIILSPTDLSIYSKSHSRPSKRQLQYASKYFNTPTAQLSPIFAFRNFPPSECPEVTVLGRSNVGKSSLLNALFNTPQKTKNHDKPASESKKPGHTKSMNAIGLGGAAYSYKKRTWYGTRAMVLVDMPGYGHGSRDEWGKEIIKYLSRREQLGMRFLLVDAAAGIQEGDKQILEILVEANLPYTLVLSKVDRILGTNPSVSRGKLHELRAKMEGVRSQVEELQNEQRGGRFHAPAILGCSAIMPCGMDGVRWAMMESTRAWNEKHERALLDPLAGKS